MNPPPTPTLPWAKPWLGFLAFFAAYAALYSHPHFNLPLPPWMIPVFPGTSLIVAALLLTPVRYWPVLLTGSGLIAIACNLFFRQLDWTLDLVRVVANVAQAAVTAWLTRRFCGGGVDLERMPHIVTLTISGILGTLTAAIPLWFLVAPALPRGELNLPLARFASHLLGTSVLTVLVITWVPALLRLPKWRWQRVLEAGVLLLFSLGVFHLAFRSTTDDLSTFAAPYLALLPVLVAAVRFGAPGTAGLMALLAVETIAAVGRGYGWPEGGTLYERLAAAQLSLAATAVTALLLAAYVAGTERALRLASEREFRIRSLFEHMRDAVCAVREGLIVLVNPEFVRLFGQKHEADLVGKPLTDLVAPADRERLQLALQAAASDVTPAPSVTVQGLAGRESTVPVEARLSGYEANDVPVVLVSFRDVTELERSVQLARRSNRVLRVVSACDRVLVGASAEAGVLSEICRAATAEAGYRFAWIGFVNHDEEKTVVPMASAGFEDGYLVRSPITWRPDRPEGRGPCGQCVRSGRPFVCRDTAHDPNYAPWRDEAIRRGYRSSVALPLVADGWVFGVFNLYSDFADDFGPDELPLLQQMTSSLASTITALRAREKQKETEAEVRRLLEEAENARGALLSILEDEQRAQAERLRSEDRYHNAIVNSAIGMAMVSPEGHWLDVNPAFCRMVGHTAEELLGRNADEVTHPADRAAGARRRERLASGSDTSFVAEKRLLHKSGRIVWVQLSVSRVEPDGPDSRRVFCQIQDITARKLAEESLSTVAERLALALRASKFGVWRFNLQMQITEWDTRMFAIFGFPPSAVVPPLEAILARVADEDREAVRRSWSGSPACDRSYSMRFRVVWPDKQVRHVDLQGIVHDDAFGRPEWTIGVAGDITDIIEATSESERLRAQLQQARKMEALGNMAAGVAHDFNNLLTGINGFVELASTTLPDGHEANKLLERAKKGAISARDLVRRILNFSRNSNEQTRTQVDLLGIVRDTAPLIVASMPSNVSVSIAAQCDKAIVFADIGQIQQVLMNLCTNAAHAIDKRPGKIEIGVARCEIGANEHPSIPRGCSAGPYVRLWVKDTGCGMDEATLRRIFEPFFTTKKQGEGTGLGLPIVNDIVNAHDGGLDVASVVGCGTTFSLYFPLLPEEAPSVEPAAGFPPTTGAGQRILVVDDEASVGMIVRLVLQRNGYQPELYSASRDAWKRLQEDPLRFQLLVIDQNMPETTGTKFIQQAREIAPDLPVILMSGRFESTNEADGHEPLGVSRLKKPFELADLVAAVAAGLEWRRDPAVAQPRSAP